jgi:hypothetical protein
MIGRDTIGALAESGGATDASAARVELANGVPVTLRAWIRGTPARERVDDACAAETRPRSCRAAAEIAMLTRSRPAHAQ